MPQIGWFEILVVVILAILIIGPKDIPIVLRKVGNWINSIKKYFSNVQNEITDIKSSVEEEISIKNNFMDDDNKKKDKSNDK
jgi:sec-independent protein translocase protein TatB